MMGGATIPSLSSFYILAFLFISVVTGQTALSTTTIPSSTSTAAQISNPTTTSTTTSISLTPAMSAASVSSLFAALESASPQQPGSGEAPGEGNPNSTGGDSDAGASGSDTESISLSTGAIIAIIVVAAGVIIIGITTATLWYFAKKRSWEVRASIRKSARKVATALTPRRSTFPKDTFRKDIGRSRRFSKGLTKIEEVPNSPRLGSNDVEKASGKMSAFEVTEPEAPGGKRGWGTKFGR